MLLQFFAGVIALWHWSDETIEVVQTIAPRLAIACERRFNNSHAQYLAAHVHATFTADSRGDAGKRNCLAQGG